MSEADGLKGCQKIKEQKDAMTKRMREKGCNLGNEKFMNSSNCETS
jgi:hypothetical protein